MKRLILVVVLGLGLALVMISRVRAEKPMVEPVGTVSFETMPSGIAIYNVLATGDDFLCQTPCTATFPRGQVTVKARQPGMREVIRTVEVKRRPTVVKVIMEVVDKHTLVTVDTSLELDEAEVDGIPLFAFPAWVVVPYGEHVAIGKRAGRIVWEYDFVTKSPRVDVLLGPPRPTM